LVGGRRPLGRRRTNGWDRVQSAGRPGMATSEASYGEDGTPHGSVLLHGLQRIGRARRVVAADLAVKRTDDRAVGLEHADQNVLHRTGPISRARQWSRSAPSRRAEAAPAGASARTIINGASGIEASRSLMRWRSRRRVRLRVTAPPTERPTMNPIRAESLGGPARCMSAWTTTVALPARRPLRTTAVNSSRDRIRAPAGNTTAGSVELRQPDAGDPSAADSTAPNDRPGCASAGGSHASCADAGCWAETYACSLRTAPGQEISYILGVAATTTVTTGSPRAAQARAHDSRRTQSDLKTIRAFPQHRQTLAMPASAESPPEPVDNRLSRAPNRCYGPAISLVFHKLVGMEPYTSCGKPCGSLVDSAQTLGRGRRDLRASRR